MMGPHLLYLFGGDRPWHASSWVTSDDRVRGGSSTSSLDVLHAQHAVRFHGHLDTTTLGGAGFASQHTADELHLDLSSYAGIAVSVLHDCAADRPKRYALTLKDEMPGRRDDGRERSTVSWEAAFQPSTAPAETADRRVVLLRWDDFVPTYRGREKRDARPLDPSAIKRIGLMMRSFFNDQEGDFQLDLHSIAAVREPLGHTHELRPAQLDDGGEDDEEMEWKRHLDVTSRTSGPPWWKTLSCGIL